MAKLRAIIDYVKIEATVDAIEDAVKVVADIRPRIRALVDHVEVRVMIEESPFVITWSIWDGGASVWDVVDGVPQSQWDIGLL